MAMAKKLPLLAPSIHTFEVNGTYTDCEAKRTVFMAIQKMVSAGKYYRIPYHGSSKKGYSYKRKDGGLTITLADYPEFKKRYITLSGVNLARIAGDPSRLSLTDLSPEGLATQEQAFLDELEQLGLLEIEDVSKPYPSFGAKKESRWTPQPESSGIRFYRSFNLLARHLIKNHIRTIFLRKGKNFFYIISGLIICFHSSRRIIIDTIIILQAFTSKNALVKVQIIAKLFPCN